MWSYASLIVLVSICAILGTIVLTYQQYYIGKMIIEKKNCSSFDNVKPEFKLSPEKVSGPIVVPFLSKGGKIDLHPECQYPLHHGIQNCTNTPSLRFYLDTDTITTLAFKYSGCGGNSNNFKTYEGTWNCFPHDYTNCPIASPPINNLNSNSAICAHLTNEECTGPNAYCKRGAFFGTCCDKTIRDKENSDTDAKTGCSAGSKKYTFKGSSGFTFTLLGKTCDSKFCPEKSTCHQGNYFAYCCEVV